MSKKGKNSVSSIQHDFDIFSKGIERLEELRAEFNSLNAKGYESEAASIRSKLKNVSDIPIIESELSILKKKISGKHKSKLVKTKKKSCPDHIEKKLKELESKIDKKSKPSLNSNYVARIKELKEEIEKKGKQSKIF
jgi:hypothetical protein